MRVVVASILIVILTGCDNQRVSTLEKDNRELKDKIQMRDSVTDLDLRAKCSRDAKAWFDDGWRGTQALLLDHTNHYNKAMNKCFILVEYHYSLGKGPDWINHMTLSDVYANSTYGTFSENHFLFGQPATELSEKVIGCEFGEKKCKSLEEFNDLLRPYMND